MELKPAKSPIKSLRDHDYYWFLSEDRPVIAELIGGDWMLPGVEVEYTTEEMEAKGLRRWRRVQFPVALRMAYDLPRGYGKKDRDAAKRRESKELKRAKRKFFSKERTTRGKNKPAPDVHGDSPGGGQKIDVRPPKRRRGGRS